MTRPHGEHGGESAPGDEEAAAEECGARTALELEEVSEAEAGAERERRRGDVEVAVGAAKPAEGGQKRAQRAEDGGVVSESENDSGDGDGGRERGEAAVASLAARGEEGEAGERQKAVVEVFTAESGDHQAEKLGRCEGREGHKVKIANGPRRLGERFKVAGDERRDPEKCREPGGGERGEVGANFTPKRPKAEREREKEHIEEHRRGAREEGHRHRRAEDDAAAGTRAGGEP